MKLFATIIGALAAFTLAAFSAHAQTTASAPSAASLEQARHLIKTMHAEQMIDQIMTAMEKPMIESIAKGAPPEQQQKIQALEDSIWGEFKTFMPRMIDQMAVIYATDFTEQELTEMDQFYSSPTGQSVLSKIPRMSQQMVPVMMAEMPALMGRSFDRFCDKTHCSADERAALAKAVNKMRASLAARPG